MTNIEAALRAFIIHSLTIIILLTLIRNTSLLKLQQDKFREILKTLNEVDNVLSKLFIMAFLLLPYIFRRGAYAFLSAYAVAGLAIVGYIADWWDLVEIQQILLDFYNFVERALSVIFNN